MKNVSNSTAGVKDSSAAVKKSIISRFYRDLGIDDRFLGSRVSVDDSGYFHLCITGVGWKADLRLDGYFEGHMIDVSFAGFGIDMEKVFDVVKKLRNADLRALIVSIKKVWREMTGRDDLYFDYKEKVIKSK